MDRFTRLALLSLTGFLVLFPLVVGKPGMPLTLKADEPAYLLSSLSLALDGDLRCEKRDIRRWFDEFPLANHRNLILMSDDGWETVYFGKPYLYPLLAAPAAALFGANGMVAVNMLLLMAMVWMGASYLSRFNPSPVAALFAAGFFLLSVGFVYVFWLQPEIFNMAAVTAGLYLAFHELGESPPLGKLARLARRLVNPATLPALSAAALACGGYNKPVLGAFALPALYLFWRRRGWRGVASFVVGGLIAAVLISGLAVAFTGHPSAYLGVARGGFSIQNMDELPTQAHQAARTAGSPTQNSWSWIARIPDTDWLQTGQDVGFFLWGRHTGLLWYTPFAALALLLFALFDRRSLDRWLTLGALALVAAFFLIWIPFNWHGGGGFVGNRYFINAYPGFLFLVTRIRPAWLTVPAFAAAGLLLGPLIFTPFGAPVVEGTLQAHTRNPPFTRFPLEMPLHRNIPGYRGVVKSSVWFLGRKDNFRERDDELWVQGGGEAEIVLQSAEPIEAVYFEVRNQAPDNRIELELEGDRERLDFPGTVEGIGKLEEVVLEPSEPAFVWRVHRVQHFVYRLRVRSRTGQIPALRRNGRGEGGFFLGAALTFLGTRRELEADIYDAAWSDVQLPSPPVAGELFEVKAVLRNRSDETWPAGGPRRVNLAYHWLDESGAVAVWEGRRTGLPRDVPPSALLRVTLQVLAPETPGAYTLLLDPLRARIAWFSEKRPGTAHSVPIEVLPAPAGAADAPPF